MINPHPSRRAVALGLGLLPLIGHPAWPSDPAGHVEEVRGRATGMIGGRAVALAPPDQVFIGETVATGGGARAGLKLGATTALRMGELARIRIDRYLADAGGEITLEAGPLLLDKEPGKPDQPVNIRGSFGLITVRGTQVFVGPGLGVTGVFVVHGLVEVTAHGTKVVLRDGLGTNLKPGQPPTAPAAWGQNRIAAALASVD